MVSFCSGNPLFITFFSNLDSFYDDDEDLDEETGLDGDESYHGPKIGEANNNSLLGLSPGMSPGSALDKTPPMADSSTERDLMNDSEGIFNLLYSRLEPSNVIQSHPHLPKHT